MKKLLALILTLSMLLAFAACGNETETEEPVVPAVAPAESDEPTDDPEPSDPGDPGEVTEEDPVETAAVPLEPSDATPLMWRVTCPDGQTMYLFGSMHAGEPTLYPLPHTIMNAFNAADYLAVEVDMLAFINDMAALMAFQFSLMYDDGSTIIDEIGEDLHARAVAVIEESGFDLGGIPLEMLDIFRPFVWWSDLLTGIALEQSGLSADYGLDMFFITDAYERGIEVLEVESVQSQMELLLGFSTELQMLLIEQALDIELNVEGLLWLYETFKYGDLEEITSMRESILDEMPEELGEEYYYGLLINRDIIMADAVEQYFAEGKSVFYVVGLLHMVGENGVVDLLIQRGYDVELVEIA
jgi:hypothetical protein